jgi:hypothetical protein
MLTLDDFTKGPHNITLQAGQSDTSSQLLVPSPPLGRSRQTIFTNPPNQSGQFNNEWNQPCTLDIGIQSGKGIFIVNSGFGVAFGGQVNYGTMQTGPVGAAPTGPALGLNLGKYSGFRINFAGIAASVGLVATVVVGSRSTPGLLHDFEKGPLPPSQSPFSVDYLWTGFDNGPFDPSDIDGIQILLAGGGLTITYGITSFAAVP